MNSLKYLFCLFFGHNKVSIAKKPNVPKMQNPPPPPKWIQDRQNTNSLLESMIDKSKIPPCPPKGSVIYP